MVTGTRFLCGWRRLVHWYQLNRSAIFEPRELKPRRRQMATALVFYRSKVRTVFNLKSADQPINVLDSLGRRQLRKKIMRMRLPSALFMPNRCDTSAASFQRVNERTE